MRIIFLDIDGVLNQLQKYFIDKKCVQRLSSLVDIDVKIVLISSWRFGLEMNYDKCSSPIKNLRDICKQFGFDIKYKTQKLGDRHEEVFDFMKGKSVSGYIVLDDDKSEYSSIAGLNLYLINSKTGLTDLDIIKIRKMFK